MTLPDTNTIQSIAIIVLVVGQVINAYYCRKLAKWIGEWYR